MKKLFTLVFAACASLSVSAVEKDLVTLKSATALIR